jgi:hypothetical protein
MQHATKPTKSSSPGFRADAWIGRRENGRVCLPHEQIGEFVLKF